MEGAQHVDRFRVTLMESIHPLLEKDSPFVPDSIDAPSVTYGGSDRGTLLTYPNRTGHIVRVTFDRWDSLRVCRGEHAPYEGDVWIPVGTVADSRWLRERFEYESRFYGHTYGFNNDVGEMLTEFEHYLFSFHDQFVEIIAGGIWFELDGEPASHPLASLPETAVFERVTYEGIVCQIRKDPRTEEELLRASRFCDQSLYQLALELDGRASVDHTLTVRTRHGKTVSRWRGYFGKAEETFEGIPPLDALRPRIAQFAKEVAERRRAMGKT